MSSRRLDDGQTRKIRKYFCDLPFDVIAYREDSETPYIFLKNHGHFGEESMCLTDSQAIELINRLQKALEILPSSK